MNQPTVILVEDTDIVRATLSKLLSHILDVRVVEFDSGVSFLDNWDGEGDCLVLDMRMPVISGTMVLDELGKRQQELPTILISGHTEEFCTSKNMQDMVRFKLQKPFKGAKLAECVESVLETA